MAIGFLQPIYCVNECQMLGHCIASSIVLIVFALNFETTAIRY